MYRKIAQLWQKFNTKIKDKSFVLTGSKHQAQDGASIHSWHVFFWEHGFWAVEAAGTCAIDFGTKKATQKQSNKEALGAISENETNTTNM